MLPNSKTIIVKKTETETEIEIETENKEKSANITPLKNLLYDLPTLYR